MFRFTIRDVLWLMVVVGMGVGWFVHVRAERAARERERQEFEDSISKWGKAMRKRIVEVMQENSPTLP